MAPFPVRFVLTRIKRSAVLILILASVASVALTALTYLRSDGVVAGNVLAAAAAGAKRALEGQRSTAIAGGRDVLRGERKRGLVQFYPDNQDKMLFRRKQDDELDLSHVRLVHDDVKGDGDEKYAEHVKERLLADPVASSNEGTLLDSCEDVHIFYYAWYAAPPFDDSYAHWNHKYLPNWDKRDRKSWPSGQHNPAKDDIGSNFFPRLGAYSSRNPAIIADHMLQIRRSGAGVLVLSWYPPGLQDDSGLFAADDVVPSLLDAAEASGLKLALLVEPYDGLNATNFRAALEHVFRRYWNHPAFYKRRVGRRHLPVFYLYDSYRVPADEWQRLFSRKGDLTVRDTEMDAIFLGLLVEMRHRVDIKRARMDGFFTYFAANGFSYGSGWKNWRALRDFAQRNSLLFAPSVGPGYVDTRVRPWNSASTRDRRKGTYYDMAWRSALSASPHFVSVTSFNEWHEGTQIEEAVPKVSGDGFRYLDYEPHTPDHFLDRTRNYVSRFAAANAERQRASKEM